MLTKMILLQMYYLKLVLLAGWFFFFNYLFVDLRQRDRDRDIDSCCPNYSCIHWLILLLPWLGIEPTTEAML